MPILVFAAGVTAIVGVGGLLILRRLEAKHGQGDELPPVAPLIVTTALGIGLCVLALNL